MNSSKCVAGAPWAFIAVMGVTGAGKSSFIRDLTKNDTVKIGHDLESCTTELMGYTFHHEGYNINLIDTPGFDDTTRSENEILHDIAHWLEGAYKNRERLSGIIYLHNIGKPRMEGSALRNLKMFRMLCGDEPLKNVILATTFWANVDEARAEKRENELTSRPDFWGQMLAKGSRMMRYRERNDGLNMLTALLGKDPVTLEIQHEMVVERKELAETQAGQAINEELAELEAKHKADNEALQKQMEEAIQKNDDEMQEMLRGQQDRVERELERINRQWEQLNAEHRAERMKMETNREAEQRELAARFEQQHESFEKAVADLRVNEINIEAADREKLEMKIAELEENAEHKESRHRTRHLLYAALQIVFPVGTLALLGVPLTLPDPDESPM